MRQRFRCGGFTYLGLLFAVALFGAGLALGGTWWSHAVQRERERDLLFAGGEFRRAIEAYRAANPGAGDGYPRTLEVLLEDPNGPTRRRWLRRIYVDPFTGKRDWGLVRLPSGGIVGVYSLSLGRPILRHEFPGGLEAFASATRHSEWRFVAASVPAPQTSVAGPRPQDASPGTVASVTVLPGGPAAPDGGQWKEPDACESVRMADFEDCSSIYRRLGRAQENACLDAMARRQSACRQSGPGRLPGLPPVGLVD